MDVDMATTQILIIEASRRMSFVGRMMTQLRWWTLKQCRPADDG